MYVAKNEFQSVRVVGGISVHQLSLRASHERGEDCRTAGYVPAGGDCCPLL